MHKGPKGQKRPADVVRAVITVAKIATGEIEETTEDDDKDNPAVEVGRKGGTARAEKLSQERRSEIARNAATTRRNRKSE